MYLLASTTLFLQGIDGAVTLSDESDAKEKNPASPSESIVSASLSDFDPIPKPGQLILSQSSGSGGGSGGGSRRSRAAGTTSLIEISNETRDATADARDGLGLEQLTRPLPGCVNHQPAPRVLNMWDQNALGPGWIL